MPSLFIKTYGCQMNERDSEQVAASFVAAGYSLVHSPEQADVVLINACSVREKAELKAIGKMGMLMAAAARPHTVFGITGCMGQSLGRRLFCDLPRLDVVTGTQRYHRLLPLCDTLLRRRLASHLVSPLRRGEHICDVQLTPDAQNLIRDHLPHRSSCSAFVSIMQGCNMRCSYCIVPSTRGTEVSRPAADILDEVRRLVERDGVREVTLLGQIVNRYGCDQAVIDGRGAFVRLLEAVHEIEGLERIRFTSPHPIGFREDLVRAYTYLPKLCSHIHFPMQSGSDRILQLMRRPYRQAKYIELCHAMRAARPDLAITTDIIVGFPGETEEDYLLTRAAVQEVQFDNAFIFQFSPRRGTPAAAMPDQVCLRDKQARNRDLLDVVNRIATARNHALVGSVQLVLVDGPSKTNPDRLQGRSSQNKPIVITVGHPPIGSVVPVRITECSGFTLYGEAL